MNVTRCTLLVASFAAYTVQARSAERPNFVWIVSEDNSKHYLRLLDPSGTPTPHIEQLAANGLTFVHAFSNSPVCSVARTTLATGVYAPRLATQFHRKVKPVTLPSGWRMFPAYLRDAGYYTTNNVKTDYNAVASEDVWNESSREASWRNRSDENQPFFHMESYGESHESSLHFTVAEMASQQPDTEAGDVTLAPYHPDTPVFRYTVARYHDRIRAIDKRVGDTIAKLKNDGLLEETFVFYFGDHGGVLPRSKGYAYDTGLHIPLVVRVPQKWKHLVDAPQGATVSGFVEFVDFGPTVLNLAGVPSPNHMDGDPFLGDGVTLEDVNARIETFGYADRFDEKYELVRTLRQGAFKYHRNYQAHYPDGLQNNYRYRMLAYAEWRDMFHEGQLDGVRRAFFEPKSAEALYDLKADPFETKNLAGDPAYASKLKTMRARLKERLVTMPDLSFLPESILLEEALLDPVAFGEDQKRRIARLIDTADLALDPFDTAKPQLMRALRSDDPVERAWALTVCAIFGNAAQSLGERARLLLQDDDELVRVRAVEFLARIRVVDPEPTLKHVLRTTEDSVVAAIALNTAVYVRDALGYDIRMTREDVRATGDSIDRRLEYLSRP